MGSPMESPAMSDGSSEMSLFGLWGLMRRRKGLILFGLVLGLGLAALYFFQTAPQYESQVQILVMQKDANLPARGVESDEFGSGSRSEELLSTHIEIFQSPRIIKDAIEKYQLKSVVSPPRSDGQAAPPNPIAIVKANLTVTKGGEGQAKVARVLKATFRGPSPDGCAQVLRGLVASYQDFLGQTFQETSSEAVKLITQAKEELRDDLAKLETEYQEFRKNAPLFWEGNRGVNFQQENVRQFEGALVDIRLRRADVTARLEVIQDVLQGKGPQELAEVEKLALIGGYDVERLSLMLTAARGNETSDAFLAEQPVRAQKAQTEFNTLLSLLLEERRLLADYGPDHPEVKKVRNQIETAQVYVEAKGASDVQQAVAAFKPSDLLQAEISMLRHDLEELDKREKRLLELAGEASNSAKSLVESEIRDEILRADLMRKRQLFDAIVGRLNEISLIKDFGGYVTEVIAPVEVPVRPVAPIPLLVMGIGAVLGLLFGSGLAYVVDIADRTFRNPEEVRHALQLPLMGNVPSIPTGKRGAVAARNGEADGTIASTVVAYHRPRSREAEAFRGLRTALYFATCRSGQKVIQITSPNPEDGKTTVTANLAVSLAQSGKRVLVVDGDLRHPSQHRVFGLLPKRGVSNVIVGEIPWADAIQDVGVENLALLPCGPSPPNPSELLASAAFEHLLQTVRDQYDYVLVDSPPLLAVSDPSVIAPRVDGVLLTIRITKNGAPPAIHARRMLAGLGARVIGVVIDGFRKDRHYGQYGSYGAPYGYGYGSAGGNGVYYQEDENGEARSLQPKANGVARSSVSGVREE
jgi:capsular exopolysaccharide synthesis family protein